MKLKRYTGLCCGVEGDSLPHITEAEGPGVYLHREGTLCKSEDVDKLEARVHELERDLSNANNMVMHADLCLDVTKVFAEKLKARLAAAEALIPVWKEKSADYSLDRSVGGLAIHTIYTCIGQLQEALK